MMILPVFILAVWMLSNLWQMLQGAKEKKLRLLKMTTWAVAILIVLGVNWVYHIQARSYANEIVKAVIDYKTQHNSYPPDLQTVGFSREDFEDNLWRGAYFFKEGRVSLFYKSTYDMFGTENYDFSKGGWFYIDM